METLKYTVIKNPEQYQRYCNTLEELAINQEKGTNDEIELLTVLIEKWDNDHTAFNDSDPVELLKALMEEHDLKAKDLTTVLNLSKGTISKILNYQKGFSKDTIRKLSAHFKVTQEAFNRPYRLHPEKNNQIRQPKQKKTINKKS